MNLKIKIAVTLVIIALLASGIGMLFMEWDFYQDEVFARDEARKEEERLAAEAAEKAKYEQALKDEKQQEIQFDSVGEYYDGRAVVKLNGKFGVIDESRKLIVDTIYDEIANFTMSQYTKVKKDGKWGYISRNGTVLIPTEYYYCGKPHEDIVVVGNNGQYGYMKMDGTSLTGLKYDKVEDFGKDTAGAGKVILNQKYGYVDATGKEFMPLINPYVDENADFIGVWNRTDVHSGESSKIEIMNQQAHSFEFVLTTNYYTLSGTLSKMADIVSPNVAEYVFEGAGKKETVRFERIDDYLQITTNLSGGNLDFDKNINITGKYILGEPEYKNANMLMDVFKNQKTLDSILAAIEEELYNDIFLKCVKEGLYEEKDIKDTTIPGKYYYFYIPTTDQAFKMLIAKDTKYVYFQARSNNSYTYKSSDPQRQNMAISSVVFDEV